MDSHRKHVIVFSHGFGVERDARGMFTEISHSFPDVESILFDYNIPNRRENTLTVRPLSEQQDIFLTEIAEAKNRFPDAVIDIIAHSLGCVIVALAQPDGIRTVIFLAPPFDMHSSSLQRFADRPGSIIDPNNLSRLARRDGSFTLVPAEFWKERESINPVTLYNLLAEKTELTIIRAKQDEVIGGGDVSQISPKIEVIEAPGDHDFRNVSRKGLLITLSKILQ